MGRRTNSGAHGVKAATCTRAHGGKAPSSPKGSCRSSTESYSPTPELPENGRAPEVADPVTLGVRLCRAGGAGMSDWCDVSDDGDVGRDARLRPGVRGVPGNGRDVSRLPRCDRRVGVGVRPAPRGVPRPRGVVDADTDADAVRDATGDSRALAVPPVLVRDCRRCSGVGSRDGLAPGALTAGACRCS